MYLIVESLRAALISLRGRILRTVLTLLSIAVGVATIIAIVSIMAGLDGMVTREFSRMGTRVLYISRRQWGESRGWRSHRVPRIGQREIDALNRVNLAEYVVPTAESWATLSRAQKSAEGMQVIGTSQDYHLVREIPLRAGRFFTAFEADRGRFVCVLGSEVHRNLFEEDEDPINEYIEIERLPFRVIGVIEKQGNFMTNMSGLAADNKVFIPLLASNRMFGRWRGVEVMVSAPTDELLDETEDEVRMMLRASRGLKPHQPDNFGINKQDYLLNQFRQTSRILWAVLVGVAGLSLLVGGVGIMNIMLISVTERTREIGVRKALGAKRYWILLQFLLEALLVCWLGGLIGAMIGIFFAAVVAAISPLMFVVSGLAVALAFAFTSATGIFFGLYPAIKAAKKPPVEALRFG